ncbi:MAG: plastocyanin/azurin family copper-binding protein [Nitrosopumilus sp.]|nr:plastocyanin/azurin family copper-binding protein [Nitrosopumilus sp.]MDF2423068.1 plastocyanin/azurin family copper-binding protein [Nitrosopumilus sp.]MDF2424302.1 plastocyanin/azurin family copper-binding protein [Nitrosopumilus sp.]MDF2425342.1 plastocyanin/azurin family copper-binding protein [Nitrosopumilus sp.]MDF2427114.1 plastocyanin/azurin family copper-binding protein [Nitrosopumilus sp.]
MKHRSMKISVLTIMFSILIVSFTANEAIAESVPEWVKNNALWYGQGNISETEFLNAIKFLIDNGIIVIDSTEESISEVMEATIIIPNGNFDVSSVGFYSPLNLEINAGTTVIWANEDSVPHTIQSQDEVGKVIDMFNSASLNTGDRFEFTFEESGVYNYFCSFHPWRVGVVTVK